MKKATKKKTKNEMINNNPSFDWIGFVILSIMSMFMEIQTGVIFFDKHFLSISSLHSHTYSQL